MRAFGSRRSRGPRSSTAIGSRLVLAVLAVLGLFAIVGSTSAMAGIDHELAVFSDCPTSVPGVDGCAYSTITGGEFKLGSKAVPIVHPLTLQGGLKEGTKELTPAADGNTLSKTPETIPGGLVGIGLPGEEITATAELAGPVFLNTTALLQGGPSVQLPLKVKLDNVLLGATCYVGTEAEPISLTLTTGTTSPPPPNTPISGKTGKLSFAAAGNITRVTGTVVVANEFAAPGSSGCGPLGIEDPVVNLAAGLPAAAGTNSVVQETEFLQANPEKLKNQAILPAIGRCVKTAAKHTGEFETSKCVSASPGEGNFEWQEGPGAKAKFTTSGGKVTLQGVGGATVQCKKSTGSGQYTGAKSLTATLAFTGCALTSSKAACQSSGAGAGEIVTSALAGQLGFIEDQSGPSDELLVSVGVDLSHSPSLIAAECAGLSEAVTVTGSVIGSIGKLGTMVTANTLTATQATGKQSPEAFEEQPKDTLSATLGSGAEQAGLASKVTITNEEKLEVKAAQE
jgi:hypothetical protein